MHYVFTEQRHDKNVCKRTSTSPKTRKSPIISSKSSHSRTSSSSVRGSSKSKPGGATEHTDSCSSKLNSSSSSSSLASRVGESCTSLIKAGTPSPSSGAPSSHSHKLKNHSMPVVKVERMPSPIMVKKTAAPITVATEEQAAILLHKTNHQHHPPSPFSTNGTSMTNTNQACPQPKVRPPTPKTSHTRSPSPAGKTKSPSPHGVPMAAMSATMTPPPPSDVNLGTTQAAIPGMGGLSRVGEIGGGGSGGGGGGKQSTMSVTTISTMTTTITTSTLAAAVAGGGTASHNSGSSSNNVLANKKTPLSVAMVTTPSGPLVLPPREKLLPCKGGCFLLVTIIYSVVKTKPNGRFELALTERLHWIFY